jgi:mRNA interferase RelE/StbE
LAWTVEIDSGAKRDLAKLDPPVARRILKFLRERIASVADPRSIGAPLHGSKLGEFWKYRLGAYRLICSIEDRRLVVLVLRIGHRRDVYS